MAGGDAAVAARVGLTGLYTATPSQMTFVPDPAHAGYETAVVVGDPKRPGIYAVQTRLPANIRIDPHTHGEKWRIATVLSGTLYYGTGAAFDEKTLKALPPGSVLVEPHDAPHFALTKDEPVLLNIVGAGMGGAVEQNMKDMDPKAAADMAKQHPSIVVGFKSAHFGGPEWISVDNAIAAGKLTNTPIMVDFGTFRSERDLTPLERLATVEDKHKGLCLFTNHR